jgi:hypothetical protein
VQRTRAPKALREGKSHAQAARAAQKAIAFVEQSDFLPVHADALMDLAEILRLAGRPGEAGSAVEGAIRLYEQKGNVVAAAKARAQLEALGRRKPETGGRA